MARPLEQNQSHSLPRSRSCNIIITGLPLGLLTLELHPSYRPGDRQLKLERGHRRFPVAP